MTDPAAMSGLVDIVIEDARWEALPMDDLAERAATAALAAAGVPAKGREIALLACDDTRIRALNRDFRGRDAATNVLSWPATALMPERPGAAPPAPPPEAESLGDIAIAWDCVAAEAGTAGVPVGDHVLHLILHATLHLLGYDHETEADAALMEGIESRTLVRMGVPDPYSKPDPQNGSLFRLER